MLMHLRWRISNDGQTVRYRCIHCRFSRDPREAGWSIFQLRRKREVSLSWPLVRAKIFLGSVDRVNMGDFGIGYRLVVWFTYIVKGCEYQGNYNEDFRGHQQEAEHMLQILKEGPILVRYNPSAPAEHFLDPYRDVREPAAS